MNLYNVLSNRYVGMSNFERLFAKNLVERVEKSKSLKVFPPFTFTANGQPLLDYCIYGNMEQSGTPTPSSPIYPSECGDLVASGEHAGQYKLPLTLGSTTTNIYLGEVQTTRRIKKLVLTGEEDWVTIGVPIGNTTLYQLSVADLINVGNVAAFDVVCTHFECGNYYGASTEGVQHSFFRLIFRSAETTLDNWEAFLAQQYANGTPVTIWYVLKNPTTSIVNEPIRKIGKYTDTVSMEQAGVSIPTNKGSTTLDVETTIKPSNVYIKYKS